MKWGLRISWIFGIATLIPSLAFSWDQHHYLMPLILSDPSPELKKILERSDHIPCPSEDQALLQSLIQDLKLNPTATFPSISNKKCGPGSVMTPYEVLAGGVIDEPDHGMDQDLPTTPGNPYDPNEDRKWMGGTQGSTSQGFRHMFFGGWRLSHPITTFQIPVRAVGQAPQRLQTISKKAKELIKQGNILLGIHTLGWAMHYSQDLSQPFHSVQVITPKMVPWYELLAWPPKVGFEQLVKETTRTITNYHWAYEGYVRDLAKQGKTSPFYDCLAHPENYSKIKFDPKSEDPIELAYRIAETSIELAPQLGATELKFFGPLLLQRGLDFRNHLDLINNEEYSIRPDLSEARTTLHEVTCRALANASLSSRLLIEWAFQP
jgi:hypothetical protein